MEWNSFAGIPLTANSTLIKLTIKVNDTVVTPESVSWNGVGLENGYTWTYTAEGVSLKNGDTVSVSVVMADANSIVYNAASPVSHTVTAAEITNKNIPDGDTAMTISTRKITVVQTVTPADTAKSEQYTVYVAPTEAGLTDASIRKTKSLTVTGSGSTSIDVPENSYYQVVTPSDSDYSVTLSSGSAKTQLKTDSTVTYSLVKQTAFKPQLCWLDNNDYAGVRPTDTNIISAKLYVAVASGEYTEVTDANKSNF